MSWIDGGSQSETTGIISAGDLILLGLFRKWIFTTKDLPDKIRHLAGEELPWLLEAPFGMMDKGLRTEVAKNLVSQPQQCIIAGTPYQLSDPLEILFTPHVASLHSLKSGDNYFGGNSVSLFGRHLHLSRSDAQTFTEIIGE